MAGVNHIGDVSFWYADMGGMPARRAPLAGDCTADVCIIGAGFTGLWTAYYLKKAAPDLKVIVVEKEFAGFGASGRNGGWCMGTFAWDHERYAKVTSRAAVLDMATHLRGTVAEIQRICEEQGIDADFLPTEELMIASNPAQMARLKAELAHRHEWGEEARVRELTPQEVQQRISIPGVTGALEIAQMARVQSAKLVRGLAEAVERAGVQIVEGTEVLSYSSGEVVTAKGIVRAPVILRGTEGFTASIKGHKRDWLPMNSAQIATAVLPPEVWAKIGWEGHELIGDLNNSYCYCQRTREGRITVGARGVPYKFGSKMDKNGAPDP